ncbi:hypothetical protein N657DRAFT_664278 [Parathielavia appendiculata]|uniref:Uncharacterized protein n=1 Tax=Parathielavia appendiculata TaxID=2587402 RepID=A0AAN6TZW2_9PEZI|nr:hypothetical protein N657DRAFT_664278 [Parathielavia appendiculata]
MADSVRLRAGDVREDYKKSFRTWSMLYHAAIEQPDLRLKHVTYARHSQPDCEHGLSAFHQNVQISVVARNPISLYAYILSALWAEIVPEAVSMVYTNSTADNRSPNSVASLLAGHRSQEVDISDAGPDETRWWTAVLAPDQGWRATMLLKQDTFFAPWSALAAISPTRVRTPWPLCLLFPSMCAGQGLQLPAFTTSCLDLPTEVVSSFLQQLPQGWTVQDGYLDSLITIGCHARGIRPMLLGSFYDTSVECNTVTPWLQGALAAIDVAPLWVGDVSFRMIPIDLHDAAWSRTLQSFIQQPVSEPLVADGRVSRADHCRLLFLSRSGSHIRVPVCQWRPFGGTPLEHTDLEVRVHAQCKGHGLRSSHLPINYKKLYIDRDFVSENATRSIFGWLRVDGFAVDEMEIAIHGWLAMPESDEEEASAVKMPLRLCPAHPHI